MDLMASKMASKKMGERGWPSSREASVRQCFCFM
jgi:hypothetical protein